MPLSCRTKQVDKQIELLDDWPVDRPRRWVQAVNRPEDDRELEAVRIAVRRGRPYGEETWVRRTAAKLGLASTLRPIGRPRIGPE